jgi:50S ribosomal subunit-associated GTPase HflX
MGGEMRRIIRALQLGATLLVFDPELTRPARSISQMTELKVIDRSQLIRTFLPIGQKSGRKVVELAQLK